QADLTNVTSAAVYGCGTIGILVIQWLASMGVRDIYAVGTRREQQELLRSVADCFFCNCREQEPVGFISRHTDRAGADIVFECVGVDDSVNPAVASARAGGQIVLAGNPAGDMEIGKQIYWKILRRQLTLYGTWNSSFTREEADDWHVALRAIQEGKLRPSAQITHRFSFENLKEGLRVMQDKTVFTNKVMLAR
ncbi:MAG: zinc-binding dehydrogenase, partial [Muribaculaceae bacterium]|nr:zinc-binding dehydrogenase [Muribaculaceae bacterium]